MNGRKCPSRGAGNKVDSFTTETGEEKIGIVTFLDNLTISKVFFVLEPFRKCMSRSVLNKMGTNEYAVGHRAEKCSLER